MKYELKTDGAASEAADSDAAAPDAAMPGLSIRGARIAHLADLAIESLGDVRPKDLESREWHRTDAALEGIAALAGQLIADPGAQRLAQVRAVSMLHLAEFAIESLGRIDLKDPGDCDFARTDAALEGMAALVRELEADTNAFENRACLLASHGADR